MELTAAAVPRTRTAVAITLRETLAGAIPSLAEEQGKRLLFCLISGELAAGTFLAILNRFRSAVAAVVIFTWQCDLLGLAVLLICI